MPSRRRALVVAPFVVLFSMVWNTTPRSQVARPVAVHAIAPPRQPLPLEADSRWVSRFSFLVYGDTRGRRDGTDTQYEHSLIVDAMLASIKRLALTPYPVTFVLQSGDAVVNGRDPAQWNTSFVGLINRLTTEGGVPYFLAPGNHDVTGSDDLDSDNRKVGLANYLSAMSSLIPPDGASRRLTGYPTFAFGYGNTFVLGLDSNIAGDPTQLAWATAQFESLDRSRYVNLVAFFHHPPFSSGPHGGARVERPSKDVRSLYMPLFRKYGVRLVLNGHDHLYEHWVERSIDDYGQPRRIDLITTGGGGAPIYAYSGEPDLSDYLRAYETEAVNVQHLVKPGPNPGDNPYHFVIVRVDGEDLSLDVVGVDWGRGFKPYRSSGTDLSEHPAR